MLRKLLLSCACAAVALAVFGAARHAHADDWSNYYYWGYHHQPPGYWSIPSQQRLYHGRYVYPDEQRVFSVRPFWRSWYMKQLLWWKFPQHRRFHTGYHFVLDVL